MDEKSLQEKLASGEYSISPRSGRLRKKIRVRKKQSKFSKRKVKRYFYQGLWILLVIAFVLSLAILIPEMGVDGPKSEMEKKSQQFRKPATR